MDVKAQNSVIDHHRPALCWLITTVTQWLPTEGLSNCWFLTLVESLCCGRKGTKLRHRSSPPSPVLVTNDSDAVAADRRFVAATASLSLVTITGLGGDDR